MRLNPYKFILLSLLVISGVLFSSFALAISSSSINVDVAPPSPAPGENVTITLSSYAANLDSVSISWFVNGKSVLSGVGKKTYSITAGAAGSRIQVVAKVMLPDGEIDKSVTIAPAEMVLLWQATDSYVPPFYKGKTLLGEESEIKVVALPEIKIGTSLANPKNMTYSWQKDYTNVADASGYAKNSYTFINDYLDATNNVSVTASTLDQIYSSQSNINITATQPQISFYKKDLSLGTLWETALGNGHTIMGNEIVVAAPYFVSPKNLRMPNLTFSWFINDIAVSISSGFQKEMIPLKVEAGTSGVSKLRAQVENTDKLSGTVSREISVQF